MSRSLETLKELVKGYTEMFNMILERPKDTVVEWAGVDLIENELKALEIIKNMFNITIDLRPENESSFIEIGDTLLTIDYDDAKLLKEVFL